MMNLKKIILAALLAVSMLNNNVSAFLGGGKYKKNYPLHDAVSKHNYSKVIELCQSVNFDPSYINMQDGEGKTPLHKAVEIKRNDSSYLNIPKIFGYLIFKANANVNVKDNKGNTPLFYAFNSPSCSKTVPSLFLLMGGALIDVINNDRKNLWQVYFEKNKTLCYGTAVFHFEIASLLYLDYQNVNSNELGLTRLGLWDELLNAKNKEQKVECVFEEAFNGGIIYDDIKKSVFEILNISDFNVSSFNNLRHESLKKYNS
ncbi:MAG: ankyrin repeat domain-containing protein [bacterium]